MRPRQKQRPRPRRPTDARCPSLPPGWLDSATLRAHRLPVNQPVNEPSRGKQGRVANQFLLSHRGFSGPYSASTSRTRWTSQGVFGGWGCTGTLRRLAALSIAAFATVLLPATASAAPAAKAAGGIGPVGHVNVGLLMTPGGPHKSAKPETKPFRAMNPAALRKAKLQASVAPATSSSTTGPSSAALFNGLNSPGLSAADDGDQPTPPDSTGAIGPTRYVEFVNQLVGVYDRTNLNQLSSTDMGTFTGTPSSLATSDPQMQWDPQGNRWFYAGVAFNSGFTTTYVLF